jgi:hypothetical protein
MVITPLKALLISIDIAFTDSLSSTEKPFFIVLVTISVVCPWNISMIHPLT